MKNYFEHQKEWDRAIRKAEALAEKRREEARKIKKNEKVKNNQ